MIKGIGHAAYNVENMEASLNFYCNLLGLKKAFELNESQTGKPWIVYLKLSDRQFIELFYGGTIKSQYSSEKIGYNHLCLEVDDIHETARNFKDKGGVLFVEPKQGTDRNWQCWTMDPDGNRIEFMQLDVNSPQLNS